MKNSTGFVSHVIRRCRNLSHWLSILLLPGAVQLASAQQWHAAHSAPLFVASEEQGRAWDGVTAQTQCMKNLRAVNLALRIYANDHNDLYPTKWQQCENELQVPGVLICPLSPYQYADTNWMGFDFTEVSYLLPKGNVANPIGRLECVYHGNYIMWDTLHAMRTYSSFPTAPAGVRVLPASTEVLARKVMDITRCLNNLKDLENAAIIYALDNNSEFPDTIAALKGELLIPDSLFCPASPWPSPTSFDQVDYSTISYTMASVKMSDPPESAHFSCKYHGNVSRLDGSVQVGLGAYDYPGIILGHPISQTVEPGTALILKVLTAPGLSGVTFQWRREQPFDSAGEPFTNTVPIPGATNATLVISNCTPQDAGYYDVVASSPSGASEVSAIAYVAVQSLTNLSPGPSLDALCCSNNLRQIYAALRLAEYRNESLTNAAAWSKYVGWPMALFCPADTNLPPESWDAVDMNRVSYTIDTNSDAHILATCKIHQFYIQDDGQVIVAPTVKILGATNSGEAALLSWTGGLPPYHIQLSTNLADTNWTTIAGPIMTNTAPVSVTNQATFFRVLGQGF